MTGENLVAGTHHSDFYGGVTDVTNLIKSDTWAEGLANGVGVGLDVASAAIDPFGTLVSWGAGFLIQHFDPMKSWLNDLAGDPAEVAAFATTWNNIAFSLSQAAIDMENYATNDLADIYGEAKNAYDDLVGGTAVPAIRAAAESASAVASGLDRASGIVTIVHDLVRDVIAGIIGSLASAIAEMVCTVFVATGAVVSQISAKVASWVSKLGPKIQALIRAVGKLRGYLDRLSNTVSGGLKSALVEFDTPYIPSTSMRLAERGANGFLHNTANRTENTIFKFVGDDFAGDAYAVADGSVRALTQAASQLPE